jgi:hypothetical protein
MSEPISSGGSGTSLRLCTTFALCRQIPSIKALTPSEPQISWSCGIRLSWRSSQRAVHATPASCNPPQHNTILPVVTAHCH